MGLFKKQQNLIKAQALTQALAPTSFGGIFMGNEEMPMKNWVINEWNVTNKEEKCEKCGMVIPRGYLRVKWHHLVSDSILCYSCSLNLIDEQKINLDAFKTDILDWIERYKDKLFVDKL